MNDIVDLTFKRGTALATVDNYRMFVHSVGLLRKLNNLDISKVAKGVSMYIRGAAQSLERARAIVSKETRAAPFQISSFHLSQFLYDIYLLEKSIGANDRPKIKEFRKKAYLSGKTAVKTADKYAPNQTETYRLLGVYYWLLGKRTKALTWFRKSLIKGEQLGAWPEYARTCMEMGKRLLEGEKRTDKLHRWVITQAKKYLEKARELFQEMVLYQDLQELNRLSKKWQDF